MFNTKLKRINKYFVKYRCILLFFILFVLYFTSGLFISFNNESILNNSVSVFHADTHPFYYDILLPDFGDLTSDRVIYRPLQMIIIQPFLKFADTLFRIPVISLCFIQSMCSALTILIFHKIIYVLTRNNKLSFFLSVIFGISFSVLIFTAIPGTHAFTLLSNSLLLLYVILLLKKNKKLNTINYITVFVLTFISFGISPVSIFSNIIILFYLLINTHELCLKNVLKSILIISAIIGTAYFSLNFLHKIKYTGIPFNIFQVIIPENNRDIKNTEKIKTVIKGTVFEAIYSLETEELNNADFKIIKFKTHQNLQHLLPGIILWLYALLCLIRRIKSKKEIHSFFWVSLFIIFTNIILFYYYTYSNCFLYSRNIFPYLFILLGLTFNNSSEKRTPSTEKNLSEIRQPKGINCFDTSKHTYYEISEPVRNKINPKFLLTDKYIYPFLFSFLLLQFIINYSSVIHIEKIAGIGSETHHSLGFCVLYAAITVIILIFLYLFMKNLIDKKLFRYDFEEIFYLFIKIFLLIIFISTVFPLIFGNINCVEL